MKSILTRKILIPFLALTVNLAFSQVRYHSPFTELKQGDYYMFGNNVKLRKQPNSNSEVLDLLKIGTRIKIIEKSKEVLVYNGIKSPFYKVQHNEKTGYVLGNLISLEKKESNNLKYVFTLKKETDTYFIIIRCIKNDFTFTEKQVKIATINFSIELLENNGIDGVKNILFINYLAEACGVDGGGIYFFETENDLKKVFEIYQMSEAGAFWVWEELVFPNEKDGVKGKILYKKETGQYKDEETNWIESNKTSRELVWKDGEITPKIK